MTARSRDVEAWLAIDLSSAYVLHPLSRQYFEPSAYSSVFHRTNLSLRSSAGGLSSMRRTTSRGGSPIGTASLSSATTTSRRRRHVECCHCGRKHTLHPRDTVLDCFEATFQLCQTLLHCSEPFLAVIHFNDASSRGCGLWIWLTRSAMSTNIRRY